MKNNEKQWKTVNNSEKQWKTVKNDEKRWKNGEKTMKNYEKWWKTVKNDEKQWDSEQEFLYFDLKILFHFHWRLSRLQYLWHLKLKYKLWRSFSMPISVITIFKRIILFSHNHTMQQCLMTFRWVLSLCDGAWLKAKIFIFQIFFKYFSDIFRIFFEYFEREKIFLCSSSSPRLVMLLLLISTLIPKGPLFQAIKYDRLAPEFVLPFWRKKNYFY